MPASPAAGSTRPRRKILSGASLVLALLASLIAFAPAAAAHHGDLSGSWECDTDTGNYIITWTIHHPDQSWNDPVYSDYLTEDMKQTAKDMVIDDTDPSVTFSTTTLAPGESATATQTLGGTTSGWQELEVDVYWEWESREWDWSKFKWGPWQEQSGHDRTESAKVKLDGDCEQATYEVIPKKYWDFGDADTPADGQAEVTITGDEDSGTKSWTFDTSGDFVGDDTALELPVGTGYSVSESYTDPDGFSCRLDDIKHHSVGDGNKKVKVYNICDQDLIDVIPEKVWDFGGAGVPADGEAVVTIDAGADGSKSWTFDTSGDFVGDDTPLTLPVNASYTVSESFTDPEGFTCFRLLNGLAAQIDEGQRVETVHNRCEELVFDVIPEKVWDFGGADVPADGEAVVTIDAGADGSKSWTFDTSGDFVGDDTPLTLPEGATYTVSESFTNPDGWTCERVEEPEEDGRVVAQLAQLVEIELIIETVFNECDDVPPPPPPPEDPEDPIVSASVDYVCDADATVNLSSTDGASDFVVEVNGETVHTETLEGTNQVGITIAGTTSVIVRADGDAVINENVEFAACDEGGALGDDDELEVGGVEEVADEEAAPTSLPRTGASSAVLALAAALTLGFGATLRTVSRKLR